MWHRAFGPWEPYESRLRSAVMVYASRNEKQKDKRDPFFQPQGHKDRRGIWWPNPPEVCDCCKRLKISPAIMASIPWTYHRHCRTLKHVAQLFEVSERDLRKDAGTKRIPLKCACGKFLKKDEYACESCKG